MKISEEVVVAEAVAITIHQEDSIPRQIILIQAKEDGALAHNHNHLNRSISQ